MTARIRQPLIGVLFVAFSFFLYWSCRQAPFIWDDQFLVVKNPLIRSPILAWEAFRHFLGEEPASNFYRPIQTLTYLLDYWRGGLNPVVYHDGSVLIHGLNGLLLTIFAAGFLRRQGGVSEKTAHVTGLLIGLSWLAHPIHSATVAYIAGRADSLALFFLLTGWCLWDRFLCAQGRKKWMIGILVFLSAFLAVCSKEAALIGIGIFTAWTLVSGDLSNKRQKWILAGVSLSLLGIYLGLRTSIEPGEASQATGPLQNRALLVLRALGDYLRILLYPGNLRMERQIAMVPNLFRDPASFDPFYPYLIIPGLLFVAGLALSVSRKGPLLKVRQFGVFWFVISILPVSNIFALNATIAEHWLYLPAIGFLIVLAGWSLETSPKTQQIIAIIACAAILGLTARTKLRALDWASPVVFFESTIRDGGDTARMRVNLANEYQQRGDLVKGEQLLRSVLALSPHYAQARHALVVNLMLQGKKIEAGSLFATEEKPFGSSFRGRLYALEQLTRSGKIDEALATAKNLRASYPDSWLLTVEIGRLFDKMEQPGQKISLYESFAANHWWQAQSQVELGRLYEAVGRQPEAAKCYLRAARLDVQDTALRARAEAILRQHQRPANI